MLLSRVCGPKTQGLGYLGAGGREASVFDRVADKAQNLLLPRGEFVH